MNTDKVKWPVLSIFTMILLMVTSQNVVSSDQIQITGYVNQEAQFVADNGEIYEIGDTGRGEVLADEIDVKVEVDGTIEEHDGVLVLNVIDFKILKDET